MPLFMDRHELQGLTAEQVAQAHLSDLEVQARFDVQFLAYWFDANTSLAFCLVKAERPDNLQEAHRAAHGLIPNEIISVSEDDLFRFLGTIHDSADPSRIPRALRTILFTDLEGSTSLLHEVGEADYMALLGEHDVIVRRALVAAGGREVKHTGDGFMASFGDVARALTCALAIQRGFEARTLVGAKPDLRVRIGMAAGEPVDHNDDIFGATVNLASRICDVADVGHPLTSELLRDLGLEQGFSFQNGMEVALKGFPGPILVYELLHGGTAGQSTSSP
jgi:class 3 adenylate cyclase